ncbi:electron transfer flavoprotein subunit alpha/FixB family protein [Aciditerrimonas ferrireducens]|uniref:electron transfer flavoprotein subunit alpha/FixB family protein n=1 Tax=Aciditerrimonas ferrireducens TaxID=667306 RepID=UPI0020032B61|nr:electron transfer flavoprotein subunit alpha/FixB family protein [Aciditerrimonas ferrireducens]MCK4177284.1 electron transfer flavoprotein subunit alpha/FixB family protein [Aciditerrimonas ferrireducens]
MANDVLVVVEEQDGTVTDATRELLGAGRALSGELGGEVLALRLGPGSLAEQLAGADRVLHVEHPALEPYNPEAWEVTVAEVAKERGARVVLMATTTVGMDLGPAVAARLGAPVVCYVVGAAVDGGQLVATAKIYGGKLLAEVEVPGEAAVLVAIGGSFAPASGGSVPEVEPVPAPAALDGLRTAVRQRIEPDRSDVDITAADLLVAVGRGIGDRDNLELVQELADALGAPLASSRPLVDQGWMPKSRQVGKSGLKVKPKAYLMFGISGAPEHIEGMRDAELIVACNTDPNAPIFEVAHFGTTADLFDLVPALVERVG